MNEMLGWVWITLVTLGYSKEVFKNIDRQEGRNRGNVTEVRGLISAFEIRVDNRMGKIDSQIDSLESKLDQRIKAALENPLAK